MAGKENWKNTNDEKKEQNNLSKGWKRAFGQKIKMLEFSNSNLDQSNGEWSVDAVNVRHVGGVQLVDVVLKSKLTQKMVNNQ